MLQISSNSKRTDTMKVIFFFFKLTPIFVWLGKTGSIMICMIELIKDKPTGQTTVARSRGSCHEKMQLPTSFHDSYSLQMTHCCQ